MNQSDPAGGKFAFKFGKPLCCFCLIRNIIPVHCTTILETAFLGGNIVFGLGSQCWISFKIPEITADVSIVQSCSQIGEY